MKNNVRYFVLVLASLNLLFSCTSRESATDSTVSSTGAIDRQALVTRHNVTVTKPDTMSPLSVGNGEFAFTVDVTGLQSYPEFYDKGVPLGTMAQWGWHVTPTNEKYTLEDVAVRHKTRTGQVVPFPVQHTDGRKGAATHWLRSNPQRLHLGMIGLVLLKENGQQVPIQELKNINQQLNLWTGRIESKFEVEGQPVTVELYGHQEQDGIAARISSPLLKQNRLKVSFKFPYGADCHTCGGYNWEQPDKHQTTLSQNGANQAQLQRQLDSTRYYTDVRHSGGSFSQKQKHYFELTPTANGEAFEFSVLFSQKSAAAALPAFAATQASSEKGWESFWKSGGAVDFSGSTDPRANELERRMILSQYLTKLQCAGSLPPQETGLTMNSWFGKFHLEMHWWHGVHFALWDRLPLLEKSLPWYHRVLPKARKTAQWQGYEGVRWQKMTDPQGNESPSSIGTYLIWQQPHIIYFAELIYRQKPTKETLEQYKDLVFATADFMASFAKYDENDGNYHLDAPLIPAQELFPPEETNDPPFELAYWRFGLSTAQEWRKRLGMPENKQWAEVHQKMAPIAVSDNNLYLPSASHPESYKEQEFRIDHPMVLGTYGLLPQTPFVEKDIMTNTFHEIFRDWQWQTTWGWDYPMMAMSAARLGLPEKAIDALLLDVQKNSYLPNGHNYQDPNLRIYLPGNGGLLTAVAMMAAGWDGAPDKHAPGFPDNGKWKVRWEGLHKMP